MNKRIVSVSDVALRISGRHKRGVIVQREVALADIKRRRHGCVLCRLYCREKIIANVISAIMNLSLVVKFDLDRKSAENPDFDRFVKILILIVSA